MCSHRRSTIGQTVHPRDREAWQQFDKDYKDSAADDPRYVCLCIATDGLTPFYGYTQASVCESTKSPSWHNA